MANDDKNQLQEFQKIVGKLPEEQLDQVDAILDGYRRADSEFYARPSPAVARGLLGAKIIRTLDDGETTIEGFIREIDAWGWPVYDEQEEAYGRDPGSLYLYDSSRGHFCAIAAHAENEPGVVRIIKVVMSNGEEVSSSKILEKFQIDDSFDNTYINGPGLQIKRNHKYELEGIIGRPLFDRQRPLKEHENCESRHYLSTRKS